MVSAPIRGAALVFHDGPCRASVGHDVAVPFFYGLNKENLEKMKISISSVVSVLILMYGFE